MCCLVVNESKPSTFMCDKCEAEQATLCCMMSSYAVEVQHEVAVTTAPCILRYRVDFCVRTRVNAFEQFMFAIADVFISSSHLQAGRGAARRVRARHCSALEIVHELAVSRLFHRLMAIQGPVACVFLARRCCNDKLDSRLR